jgi:hypothetical protein
MKFSFHTVLRGKPTRLQDSTGRPYYEYNGQRVNLGWGWENAEADWEDVFELITTEGLATSAELNSDNRKEATFVSRDLIMVDIDSGMTIPELFEDDMYNQYAAGFYATPSHTDSAHRFRIMFRLATPLTTATDVVKLNKMLMRRYTQADAACKDATRIFYGTPNCILRECRDRQLSDAAVAQLISQYNVWEATEMSRHNTAPPRELNPTQRTRILDLLKSTYVGEYAKWRDIGWGLKAGGYTVSDWQYVTTGMMSKKTPEMAREVWAAGKVGGKITMGTVIWFLRQRHGADCLRVDHQDALATYEAELAELDEIRQQIQRRKQTI